MTQFLLHLLPPPQSHSHILPVIYISVPSTVTNTDSLVPVLQTFIHVSIHCLSWATHMHKSLQDWGLKLELNDLSGRSNQLPLRFVTFSLRISQLFHSPTSLPQIGQTSSSRTTGKTLKEVLFYQADQIIQSQNLLTVQTSNTETKGDNFKWLSCDCSSWETYCPVWYWWALGDAVSNLP